MTSGAHHDHDPETPARPTTAATEAARRKPRTNSSTHGGGIAALVIARTSWTRGVRGERDALRAEDHKRKPKNQHHGYPDRDDHDPDPRRRQARTGRTTWVRHVGTSTNTPTPNSIMMAIAPAAPSISSPGTDALLVAGLTGDTQNVNFAVSAWAARAFLDSYDVPYETALSEPRLSASDVAAQARAYTVLVECWK